jgi:hypothetical protein
MKKLILLTFAVYLFINSGLGQIDCGKRELNGSLPEWLRGHVGNERSDTIDVLHYDLSLNFRQVSSQLLSGAASVVFTPKQSNVSAISLDLLSMNIDSVKWQDDSHLSYAYNDTLLRVQFPLALSNQDTTSITVFYRGTPQQDPSGWGGFYFQGSYAYNLGVGFSVDPHNFGRVWHPCFDNFAERATYTFRVLTTAANNAYCNGERMSVSSIGADSLLTVWEMHNPIPTYLASVAVAPYTHVLQHHTSALTGNQIPVWLIAVPADTTGFKNSFVNIGVGIDAFEKRFGPHQYNKVGFVLVPFNSGAMEHATNIAYPRITANGSLLYQSLMAHELSHHWWGDWVTTSSASEMWINEGFARWCEAIFFEELNGYSSYLNEVRKNHFNVLRSAHVKDEGHYPMNQVPHSHTYGDHSYNKGADMIHTMRGYMGDTLFYQGLQYIQQEFAEAHITSEQFRDAMITATGFDLNPFFEDWIFSPGQPHFVIDSVVYYGSVPNLQAQVFVKQKRRARSTWAQQVPLTISFVGDDYSSYDVRVMMSGELLSFTLPISFVPKFVLLNRDDKISHAVTAEERLLKTTSPNVFSQALMSVTPQMLADSVFVRVEHHWIHPDDFLNQPSNMVISRERFWQVFVDGGAGNVLNGRVDFNGTTTAAGWLDNELLVDNPGQPFTEDSIVLLYRPSSAYNWTVYPTYSVNTQGSPSNKVGQVNIQNLTSGQYALGYKTNSVGIAEQQKHVLKLYPNPAADQVALNLENNGQPWKIEIYGMEGRLLAVHYTAADVIDVSGLPTGNFIVHASQANQGRFVGKLMIVR